MLFEQHLMPQQELGLHLWTSLRVWNQPALFFMEMEGREVFRRAVRVLWSRQQQPHKRPVRQARGDFLGELLDWTAKHLAGKPHIETPRLDAEVLLAHVAGGKRIDLYGIRHGETVNHIPPSTRT